MSSRLLTASGSASIRQPGIRLHDSMLRDYLCGASFVVLLITIWPYEAPNRWLSVVAGISAFTLGFLLILWSWRRGFVHSVSIWTTAFCGKICLSWLILIVFWVGPMSPELYRASEGNHLDMIFYDYHAAELATSGWQNAAEHLNFTWLSFGVVAYAATLYTIFGINILHIAVFNAVLALSGIIALTAALNVLSGTRGRWQAMCLALFLPFGAYFDAIISKDVIGNALFYFGFLLLARTFFSPPRKMARQYLSVIVITGLIALVRVNLAMLFLVIASALASWRGSLKRVVQIAILGTVAWLALALVRPDAAQIISHILDPSEFFSSQMAFVERVSAEGASPLKVKVAELTIPHSMWSTIVWSPLRFVLWLYNPYPEILPLHFSFAETLEQLRTDPEAFSGSGHVLGAILSTWLICLETPFLVTFINSRTCRRQRGWLLLTLAILVPALVIANFSYVGGKRYRILIEPLLLAASLWAARYGKPSRYLLPTYCLILLPLVAYACITFFR